MKRTAQAESCDSLEGGIDVKDGRATNLKSPFHDHDQRGHVPRRASIGSVGGVTSQDGRGKNGAQRLPHYKQRTYVRLPY